MSTLTNSPKDNTLLRLERRKSFALELHFQDASGKVLDITGCEIRIVAKKIPFADDDSDNLFVNNVAEIVNATAGFALFEFQALDLDHKASEYPYVIVLVDPTGYSSAIIKGTLDVVDNPESESIVEEYTTPNAMQSMVIRLRGHSVIQVAVGYAQAPGTTSYTIAEQEKLALLVAGAQLPPGGFPGNVLAKRGTEPYESQWIAMPGGGGGAGIDPTGVPADYVPTANGDDTWNWAALPPSGVTEVNTKTGAVTLNQSEIPDGGGRYSIDASQKAAIDSLDTASTHPAEDFRAAASPVPAADISGILPAANTSKLFELRGIQTGTLPPSSGWSGTPEFGDVYFQLES